MIVPLGKGTLVKLDLEGLTLTNLALMQDQEPVAPEPLTSTRTR